MIELSHKRHGYTPVDAYMLCSVCADLRISSIVDVPNWVVSFYFRGSCWNSSADRAQLLWAPRHEGGGLDHFLADVGERGADVRRDGGGSLLAEMPGEVEPIDRVRCTIISISRARRSMTLKRSSWANGELSNTASWRIQLGSLRWAPVLGS